MNSKNIPNLLTVLRIFLTIPIVMFLCQGEYTWAFYLLVIASFTDAIDGYLARAYHWHSRMGSALDPLADKVLMVSVFLVLTYLAQIPFWLLGMVILREIVLVTGTIILRYIMGPYDIEPIIVSKLNTCLQITLAFLLVFNLSYVWFPRTWIIFMMYAVFTTTLVSMLAYMWIWSRKLLGRGGITHERS
jgi:cardiolipin synthase